MQRYDKILIAPYRYYKNKKYRKLLKLKNLFLIALYLAVVVFIINLANTDNLFEAYASVDNSNLDDDLNNSFKFSNGTIKPIEYLNLKEKLEIKFYEDYIGNSDIAYFTFKYANQYDLPPSLLVSLMKAESRFNIMAVNHNKNKSVDRGLCQLNSYVFKDLDVEDFFNPELNISLGAKQLRWCLDQSNNKLTKALAHYNAGYGQVKGKKVGELTLDYIQTIVDYKEDIETKLANYINSYSDLLH